MLRLFVSVFASLLISSCSLSQKSSIDETGIAVKLQGLWADLYTDDGEILSYMYYLPEKKFHAFGYFDEEKNEFWFAFGNWEMKGNKSCIRFLFDSHGISNPREEMCVTVISVTKDTFIYLDDESGEQETLKRISDGHLKES